MNNTPWHRPTLEAVLKGLRSENDSTQLRAIIAQVEFMLQSAAPTSQKAATIGEERFQWIGSLKACAIYLTRDDQATSYATAAQEIDDNPERFADCPPEAIKAMKESNTIWTLQIYPTTPIGFSVWHRATLEEVIDAARAAAATAGEPT